MSLFITSLNSGSNGNCYYVGNNEEAVLIDAGISCRETEKRMQRLGLSLDKVKAIFISHEHSDHIRGVPVLSTKYQIPVYGTPATLKYCRFDMAAPLFYYFRAFVPVQIGGLSITAFPKHHDACDPHSFVVSCNGINVGVFTDIGAPCDQLTHHFSQCHAAFLEANYDDDLLDKGRYPYHLKNRIRGGKGHLSNKQALSFFQQHRPTFMRYLLLSHLSNENNCPRLAQELFMPHAAATEIIVASRFKETPVYAVTGELKISVPRKMTTPPEVKQSIQISLF